MTTWWRRGRIALLCAAAVVIRPPVVVDTEGHGQLLWQRDKAVLYVAQLRLGYRMNLMTWPVALVFGWRYDRTALPTTVYDITRDSVVRHDFTNLRNHQLFGFGDYVSTGTERWTGDRFEPYREEPTNDLFAGENEGGGFRIYNYTDINGWSKRDLATPESGDHVIDFAIAGRPARLRVSRYRGGAAVDLERGDGRPVERLWSSSTRLRWLSRADYDAMFRDGCAWDSAP